MRRNDSLKVISLVVIGIVIIISAASFAQDTNWKELSYRVIGVTANVKPGDVVVVYGGKHTIPLMEMLAIESNNAGGLTNMFLDSDKVLRALYSETPMDFLGQDQSYFAEWIKNTDVWIALPGTENPKKVFADIPEERFAKMSKAFENFQSMLNSFGVRVVGIEYPTKENAALNQIDFDTYQKMHWEAVNADYSEISKKGQKLQGILQGAKNVRITSKSGTDFSFSIGDRHVFLDDGIVTEDDAQSEYFFDHTVNLPGGDVFVAPSEISANGKVNVPKTRCNYEPMTDISFEFKDGQLMNFKADQGGSCFDETMEPYTGPKDRFGYFSIGLNPALKVIEEDGDYRPGSAAGMVWIGVGFNFVLGGENKTQGGFNFPVTNATVEVDGQVIVKDGELQL